jgi:hypothetical protein
MGKRYVLVHGSKARLVTQFSHTWIAPHEVLPAQAKGRTVVKETRHDTDFETEEDHSFDSTQKSLETNADGGKNEQKNASDRHCNKHRNGRRNGKGWSFRNKKGPYERQ